MFKDMNSFTENATGEYAIKNSIRNILITKKGSIPGKPNFGSNIYNIIFELATPLSMSIASNYVYEALAEFENRISINNIDVNFIEEYNKLTIDVHYSYVNNVGTLTNTSTSIAINV